MPVSLQTEAALEVAELAGHARDGLLLALASGVAAAGDAGLVGDDAGGLLGHQDFAGLEEDLAGAYELELVLFP